MPSITVENYIKQIYLEQQRTEPDALVSLGKLAAAMGVVPGTVTTMVKGLAADGLVRYAPRGGARLTRAGEQLALQILRRHRLVELLLVRLLGLDWSEVHAEAEELEHAISDKVLDRIDAVLGHPAVDPHGDPIPTANGKVRKVPRLSLADCAIGRTMRVTRIDDQDVAFLQFVERCGLKPGTSLVVESRDVQADAIVVRPKAGKPVMVGSAAAGKILVA